MGLLFPHLILIPLYHGRTYTAETIRAACNSHILSLPIFEESQELDKREAHELLHACQIFMGEEGKQREMVLPNQNLTKTLFSPRLQELSFAYQKKNMSWDVKINYSEVTVKIGTEIFVEIDIFDEEKQKPVDVFLDEVFVEVTGEGGLNKRFYAEKTRAKEGIYTVKFSIHREGIFGSFVKFSQQGHTYYQDQLTEIIVQKGWSFF
uniref:Uncharacterized protein n=1 Tax=Paramoeba aestuarina TaxID=180227 RepID=A0A7S4NPR4_9EUKA